MIVTRHHLSRLRWNVHIHKFKLSNWSNWNLFAMRSVSIGLSLVSWHCKSRKKTQFQCIFEFHWHWLALSLTENFQFFSLLCAQRMIISRFVGVRLYVRFFPRKCSSVYGMCWHTKQQEYGKRLCKVCCKVNLLLAEGMNEIHTFSIHSLGST